MERGQGIAGGKMIEDQGIKSTTHRDGYSLPGTIVYFLTLTQSS